jgi:predicted transcriptional regulator
MAEPIPSLGELEVQVLRLVWREQPCTERRVTELVQTDRPVGRTTVLKTIQRLEEKGLLVREAGESRRPIRYRAALEEQRVLPALVRRFVERVLGGSDAPLAAYLSESANERLSAKDLDALRAIAHKIADAQEREG